jgi:hypothetical protein
VVDGVPRTQYGTAERFNAETLVTCNHVVEDVAKGYTVAVEGTEGWIYCDIVHQDAEDDVAFLRPRLPVTLKKTELKDGIVGSPKGVPLVKFEILEYTKKTIRFFGGDIGMSGSVAYRDGKPVGLLHALVSIDGVGPLRHADNSVVAHIVPWFVVENCWENRKK